MSGIGDIDDMPDSLIGRFIDRLDHLQHRRIKANTDAISSVRGTVSTHEQTHDELRSLIADMDSRVCALQTAFGRITAHPPTSSSHRGPGGLPLQPTRPRTYIDDFDDFLDLDKPPTSVTIPTAEQFDIGLAPCSDVLPIATVDQQHIAQLMQQTQRLDLQQEDANKKKPCRE